MKIRITTVRSLPSWNVEKYMLDMRRNGVPHHKLKEFRETGTCTVIAGSPHSETYQTTTYEVLDDVAPVHSISEAGAERIRKANEKRARKINDERRDCQKMD